MKEKIFSAFLVIACCLAVNYGHAQNTVTELQAVQFVKNQRVFSNQANYYVTSTDHILKESQCNIDIIPDDDWVQNGSSKWLVFVDEQPGKSWSHKCSYWYIPQQCDSEIIPSLHYEGYAPPSSVVLKPIQQNVPWGNISFSTQPLRLSSISRDNSLSPRQASDTHVIIVGCIGGLYDNMVRNWNACSSLYQILSQGYNIPENNFHILMGPTDGMLNYYQDPDDEYPTQTAMSKDLDGDGIDEAVVPCTWSNLQSLMRTMNLFDFHAGNLFIYYVGSSFSSQTGVHVEFHDGYMITELMKAYLQMPNATFRSMMLNCGSAWYLENDIAHDRSVIASSTSIYPDVPHSTYSYYQGTYDWLCAIAQEDIVTGTPINSDANNDGHVSFAEAAYSAYGYYDQYESNPSTLANVLALDSVPPHDVLSIAQVSSPTSEVTWNSPDIWVRNGEDGYTNQESEFLTVAEDEPLYVYVRMHNSGNANYGMRMRMLPCNTAYNLNDLGYYGSYLWEVEDGAGALSGASTISAYEWYPYPSFGYSMSQTGNVLPANYFMFFDQGFDYDNNNYYEEDVYLKYNQLIKKKHVVINPYLCASRLVQEGTGPMSHYVTVYGGNIPISLKTNGHGPYSIELLPDSAHMTGNPFTVGRMYLELSQSDYSAWQSGGSLSTDVTAQSGNARKFRLNGMGSKFQNISPSDDAFDATFYADMVGVNINNVDRQFHIVLRDSSGTAIDGQSLRIIIDGGYCGSQPSITAVSGNDGNYVLTETNVSDPAQYEWYDCNLNKVAEGKSVNVSANEIGSTAIVKVTRVKDGKEENAVAELNVTPEIYAVTPVPFDAQMTVKLTAPTVSGMALRITHVATGEVHDYAVSAGESEKIINTSAWRAGQYVVNLTHNGENVSSLMIFK